MANRGKGRQETEDERKTAEAPVREKGSGSSFID